MNLVKKSRLVSLVLTALLGPIGLLYSSIAGALCIAILMVLTLHTLIVPVFLWFVCVIVGDSETHRHNRSVDAFNSLLTLTLKRRHDLSGRLKIGE